MLGRREVRGPRDDDLAAAGYPAGAGFPPIVLAGGGALLLGIEVRLAAETNMPVRVADDPLTCVARGGGRVLELLDEYGPSAFSVE